MAVNAASESGAEWIGTVPHEELVRGARPVLPKDDPFYQPPSGFQHAEPGTVLRSRDVELAFLGLIPQRLTATQLLYRTTNMNGAPEATVTTVIAPAERPARRPVPVISYQCAIDAVSSRCFPSYALRRKAVAPGALAQFEFLLIAAAVAEGWAVSVPDHEGPQGSWGTPYEPGYRILDGLRAAVGYDRLNLDPSAPMGLWGYSGGGLASAWAAEMHGQYAPELNVVGAVLGSPVGDLGHTYRRLNGTLYSGLPAMVVAALTHVYPDLNRIIDEHATEAGKAMLTRVENMTTAQAVLRFAGMDMGKLVDRPLDEILDMPEVKHVFDSIKLGTAVPTPPVLIVQAVHDRIVSVYDIDELTETYRSGGASVTYHRDMFSEHMLLHPMSAPMALRWLIDRFDDKPLSEHIVRTTWPTLLNPMTYVGMARLVKIAAKVMTGRKVQRSPL
ncbi:lysophospholipase [Mycolicibacterium phlei]|jgi:alpha-beta hydrolase superfamily lysophospholipase|uniref:Lipase n=1 Tax=Mycolicibacterium phlei DSM 43239 = CCUG 21000 TaxID=1226750 RepID=A0A5N5V6P0_MYCPH|nr:lipase family protein [Mycolicibacterium phlei]VEG09737.1 lysophospholipase [Mycobacteroides chelonae]AMO61629.1 putative inactive lipase [Mycolicibacterium phlei]EID18116.1 lysophospholipase [Mycolicibacterium phlei RIVM601174]KAB7757551.1 lipase [Mycolicibacterium phlei DSM 43239 = CCUG 21000]KXW64083.1 lipase [Mycolicibacterium phlei DSM 43070]